MDVHFYVNSFKQGSSPDWILSPFPLWQGAQFQYLVILSFAVLCGSLQISEDVFVSSAAPAVLSSVRRPGQLCSAEPGWVNSDATAQEEHVFHCGRTGNGPPRHLGHGRAGRTSCRARDEGKCCWRHYTPSLPTSAVQHWKTNVVHINQPSRLHTLRFANIRKY